MMRAFRICTGRGMVEMTYGDFDPGAKALVGARFRFTAAPRIGIAYASKRDQKRKWRFTLEPVAKPPHISHDKFAKFAKFRF